MKLKYDEPLSNFPFVFNLCLYTKFNFLLSADPYNAYYKSKIAAFAEEAAGGDAAAVAAKAAAAAKEAADAAGHVVVKGTGAAKATVLTAGPPHSLTHWLP